MNKMIYELRMVVLLGLYRLMVFVVPKNATKTLKWLREVPYE